MKKLTVILAVALINFHCGKEKVEVSNVLSPLRLSAPEIDADGQSTITISTTLSEKSSADRRSVVFTTNKGIFVGSGGKKITVKAEYDSALIVAKTALRAPLDTGTITITAEPEFDSPLGEYIVTGTISTKVSEPATLKLQQSALGIASNFQNEILLTALLKNKNGKSVSNGFKILFEDFLPSGLPANGRFRDRPVQIADSSKVAAYYGADIQPLGTAIKIKATLLNNDGTKKPEISDSLFVTINL